MKSNITCIILTKNEELNLENCLKSIVTLAEKIVIVDSGSTDETLNIAKKYGADIYHNDFISYAHQINWALDNIKINTKWVYRIDADEVVTEKLKNEILSETRKHANDDVNGFLMPFKIYFLGKLLKHAGNYPFLNLVIWKNGKCRYTERLMGEHAVLISGRSYKLKNYCEHRDNKTIDYWITKHNWYSTREVIDYYGRNGSNDADTSLYLLAKKTQKRRDGLYYKLPLFFRCWLYYVYRFYFKLGFLDGKEGKAYCWLQAYWYRFLVDTKILEVKRGGNCPSNPGSVK